MTISDLIKTINKKEWRLIAIVIFIVVIITSLPHLYGFLNTPAKYYYTGSQRVNSADIQVYFSYLEQVKQGHWFFKDLFTSEPQQRIIFNPLWLGIGLLAKFFHLSSFLAFQLARIFLIPIFLILAYVFIVYFFSDEIKRKICFIALIFSSGLGALLSRYWSKFFYFANGYANMPVDLWVPESNTFFTLYYSPHFIASLTLFVLIFFLMLLAFTNNKLKYSLWAGLAGLFLFSFHPYHFFTITAVLGVYLLVLFIKNKKIKWNFLIYYLILLFVSSFSILYYLLLNYYDWLTLQRTFQNICLTPKLWLVLISYGLGLIFALIGVYSFYKNKKINNNFIFIITWFVVQFLLIYSPLRFQVRLTEGLHIPIIILCVTGLFFMKDYLQKINSQKIFGFLTGKIFFFFFFIIFFSFSNLFVLAVDLAGILIQSPVYYISQDKASAMFWLKDSTSEDEVIFSNLYNGNLIAGISGRAVYVGHRGETAYFNEEKTILAKWFFRNNEMDEKKQEFLKKNKIDYIFYSRKEDTLEDFQLGKNNYLEEVYKNKEIIIYKVL